MSSCAEIRRTIQEAMDGPIAAERQAAATSHLRACAECREYQEGLEIVRNALRALPSIPLPDDALDLVWERTIRNVARLPKRRSLRAIPWLAAAAAVLVTVLSLPALFRPLTRPYTPADLSQAAREARSALALAGNALRKSRHVAVTEVLAGEVSPAMRKIPIRWSPSKNPDARRPRT
jgi:predicted anti-sigma-YlaC factor YlaD